MTIKKLVLLPLLLASLVGCANSYTVGNDFPEQNVSKISDGQTSSNELVSLFGEPYSKMAISETQERWLYMLSSGQTDAQKEGSLIDDVIEPAEHKHKMLSVLVSGDVVISHKFVDGLLYN